METNRLIKQMGAVFGVFMAFFYIGIGIYIAFFFDMSTLDKTVLVIMGVSFIILGIYRAFRSYQKIVQAFFSHDADEE
jgi:cytochrome c biogenesis protein CcdA